MKTKIKQLLLLAVACLLCFCLLPAGASAAGDFVMEGDKLIKYTGSGGDVVVPDGVWTIGEDAFRNCTSLTSVTLPGSVTAVMGNLESGLGAFAGCTSLTTIVTRGIDSIGAGAFRGCTQLRSYPAMRDTVYIGPYAFMDCASLTSVQIPRTIMTLNRGMFSGCTSLTSVTLGSQPLLKHIDQNPFEGTPWLAAQGEFATFNGILFCYQGTDTDIVIPGNVEQVTANTFKDHKNLTSVIIPDNVHFVQGGTFEDCTSLKSVTLPNTEYFAPNDYTFKNCTSLTSVTIPPKVKAINPKGFADCPSLTSVILHDKVEFIGDEAFLNSTAVTLYAPEGSYVQKYAQEHNIPFSSGTPSATPATPATPVVPSTPSTPSVAVSPLAEEATQTISIDGQWKAFQMYTITDAKGGKSNYIQIRDLAVALNGTPAQFEVMWDGDISLKTKTPYTPNGSEGKTPYGGSQKYTINNRMIKVDGVAKPLDSFLIYDSNGGGHTYFKLRDLGTALGFHVDWSKEKGIFIDTTINN